MHIISEGLDDLSDDDIDEDLEDEEDEDEVGLDYLQKDNIQVNFSSAFLHCFKFRYILINLFLFFCCSKRMPKEKYWYIYLS